MTTLQALRLLLVASALGALALIALRPRAVWSVVGGFLNHRTYAVSLGVLRVILFTRLLLAGSRIELVPLTEAPASTRKLPPGWGWLGEMVPLFDADFATAMRSLFIVAGLLAILGAGTRFSAPVAALAGVYVFGLPNFFSKINHGGHLLVCFCIILAFSRCADACSVDALVHGARERRLTLSRNDTRSLAYGLPIRLCWLVLGLSYFFPGLYKTWNAGDQWISGYSLLVIAYGKLATLTEYRPLIVIYDSPNLLALLGAGTLVFELGFIFLLLSRRFWWIAPIIALSFHVGLAFSIGIIPWSIVKVFWVFLDVGVILYLFRRRIPKRVLDLLGIGVDPSTAESATAKPTPAAAKAEPADAASAEAASTPAAAKAEPSWTVTATVGGAVLGLWLFAGLAGIDSFPVSVFPRFDKRRVETKDPRPSRYMLAIQHEEGEPKEISQEQLPKQFRRARWDKTLQTLARAKRDERQSKYRSIESLLKEGGQRFKPGDRLVLYREYLQFDPETHDRVVRERKLVSRYDVGR